jgi:AcrR family transcriptional regulator
VLHESEAMALEKDAMLQAMVAHVLQHGIAEASLRPLAKAAGTSDRMLIYHFGSKEILIDAILVGIAEMFGAMLDTQFAATRTGSRQACLARVAAITRDRAMRPVMRVWMQVLAAAAAGNTGYLETGRSIVEQLIGWIEAHLPGDDPDPAATARTMLVLVEGSVVLDLAGRSDVADTALASAFAD